MDPNLDSQEDESKLRKVGLESLRGPVSVQRLPNVKSQKSADDGTKQGDRKLAAHSKKERARIDFVACAELDELSGGDGQGGEDVGVQCREAAVASLPWLEGVIGPSVRRGLADAGGGCASGAASAVR